MSQFFKSLVQSYVYLLCLDWARNGSELSSRSFFLTLFIFKAPTQSIMYVPLQVNRFKKIILLIVKYKYKRPCRPTFCHKLAQVEQVQAPSWYRTCAVAQGMARWRYMTCAMAQGEVYFDLS